MTFPLDLRPICARFCAALALVLLLPRLADAAGFPNVTRTPGQLLVGPCAPQAGRLTIIAYHNGLLYSSPENVESTSQVINGVTVPPDFAGRSWDMMQMLANPTNPQPLAVFPGMYNGFNAHGWMQWNSAQGSHLIINPHAFRATGTVGTNTTVAYNTFMPAGFGPFARSNMLAPWYASSYWVSYDEASGNTSLRKDNVQEASWDHLGTAGLKDMPMLCGNLLIYAATGSRAGVVIYDLSLYMDEIAGNEPAAPPVIGTLDEGGFGGYWPELYGWGGRLFVVNGANSLRVVEITDPTAPTLAADLPAAISHAVYPTFQDQYAWLGGGKFDMTNFSFVMKVGSANTTHTVPGIGDGKGIDTSQYNLPIGNLVVTGGLGSDQGMAIFAHQAEPDTRGPEVGFHIPRAGQTSYPIGAPITLLIPETLEMTSVNTTSFIVRPVGGSAVPGRFSRTSGNAILSFFPDAPLALNTTYEVILPAGGIKDAAGNGIASQFGFTFSTGTSVGGNVPPNLTGLTASASPVAPGGSVTLTATATDTETIEYRFDFADGTGFSAWGAANTATKTLANAGHYRASVQARDTFGAVSSRQIIVTVMAAPTGTRPTHSRQMAKDLAGKHWVVNPDHDSVTRFDPATQTREAVFPLDADAGKEDPRGIAVAANGKVWVTCHDDDAIRILNPTTGAVETTLPLRYGAAPFGICMSPDGLGAYVTLDGTGELLRYDTANPLTAPKVLFLGPTPRAIAVTGNGARLLVTRFLSGTNAGEVWDCAWNGTTLSKTRTIPLLIQGNTNGPADGSGAVNYLSSIAITPDATTAFITAKKDNINGGLLFGESDHDLQSDETVRAVLRAINLTTNAEDTTLRVDFDNAEGASAVEPSALGDYLFITQQGNNLVTVLDALKIAATSNLGAMVGRIGTGLAPQGLLLDIPNNTLAVHNFMDRSVSFLGTLGLAQTGSANLPTLGTPLTHDPASEALSPAVLFGKKLFYNASARDAQNAMGMSAEGYMSCASCHLDGAHDGRTWDFTSRGEGLRNTIDLRGRRGMKHGNVHWSGNFDESQDFVHDMRSFFGGSGFLPEGVQPHPPLGAPNAGLAQDLPAGDPLDALAAYLASLKSETVPRSVLRTTAGAKTADALAGAAIFTQQGCAICHVPANGFTDSSLGVATLSDVGTQRYTSGMRLGGLLPGLDTPTLAGLFDTAPYLHDGTAETLRDVFGVAGGEMYPVESGTLSGSATKTQQYVFINQANAPMGGYVSLNALNASVTLSGLDGGTGGAGQIELRYQNANSTARTISVLVNGVSHSVSLPSLVLSNHWRTLRVPVTGLTAGATNIVEIRHTSSGALHFDEVTVSRPADLAKAQPHRRALALITSSTADVDDFDKLIAYLQQLDGSDLSDTSDPLSRSGPTAVTDSFSVNEATTTDLAVLANDLGTGLALTNVSAAAAGTTGVFGNVVRYTPPPGVWEGADSFSYTVRDGDGRTHTGTANVTIVRAFGSNPLPSQLVTATTFLGTGAYAEVRARTDGLLEINALGGRGFDGEGAGKDELAFASRSVAGNFRATVRLAGFFGTGVAGLMLRDLANVGARFASVGATPGTDYRIRSRTTQGVDASPDLAAAPNGAAIAHALPNKWLRLDRLGDLVRTFVSNDGAAWELVDETTLGGLGHWTTVGLFVYGGANASQADATFASYKIEPLAPSAPDTATGLLARYDFENTSVLGTDTTGLHPGTTISATSSTDAVSGTRSLAVTGGQYISVPHATDLDLVTYTFAGWIKLTTSPTGSLFSRLASTRNGADFTFDCRVGATKVNGNVGGGASPWIKSPLEIASTDTGNLGVGGALAAGAWYHVAYVVDDAAKEMRLYLNGDLKRTTIYAGTPRFSVPGATLRLGNNDSTFQSRLDDLRLYGRALGGSDIAALAGAASTYPAGLRREYWTGVSGGNVAEIPTASAVSGSDVLFDRMQAVGWVGSARAGLKNDWSDNSGERLRGYLRAPSTGSYTFFIASDDASELWLSTSTNPAAKVKIAHVATANTWDTAGDAPDWLSNGTTTAKSAPITLNAGQHYFVEVLHKEGTTGDHLAVGWTKPGQTVGSAPQEIIPGSALFADPHNGAPAITLLSPASGSATVLAGSGLALSASAADDGLPGGALTYAWSVLSGPGSVTFGTIAAPKTTATFSANGSYVLRLTVSDGELQSTRGVHVNVVTSAGTPPTDSLVVHWKLDALSGQTATDSSTDATSNPGTLHGAPTWQLGGQIGGALAFATNDDYVESPDAANLDNTNKMTLAVWLRPDVIDSNARGILCKRSSGNSGESFTLFATNGQISARFNTTTTETVATASAVLAVGAWTHLTAVYDGTLADEQKVKIYIDGVAVTTTGLATATSIPDNSSKLWLGTAPSNNAPSATGWLGLLDDVRIYRGQAFTPAEVTSLATFVGNVAPSVSIQPPGEAVTGVAGPLVATVTDDGLSAGPMTFDWSKVNGPGGVTFGNAATEDTAVTFDTPGAYVLRLTANDGEAAAFAEVSVIVAGTALPPTSGLVLHWRLNETAGLTAADSSPDATANPGTLSATATWDAAGHAGGGVLFNAGTDVIEGADADNLDNATKMSLAVWVRSDATDANSRGILTKRQSANAGEAYTIYAQNGQVNVRFNNAVTQTIATANAVLPIGTWTHIAAVFDGTKPNAEKVKIFIDGVAVATTGTETDTSVPATTTKLWLGTLPTNNNPSSTGFLGRMDDVRIYRDRALTAGEVGTVMAAGTDLYAPWAAARGITGADALATANPDYDSLGNLLEFFHNTHPQLANTAPTTSATMVNIAGTDYLRFKFRRNKSLGATTYELKTSPTLAAGSWATRTDLAEFIIPAESDAQTDMIQVDIPLAGLPALFVRLLVEP